MTESEEHEGNAIQAGLSGLEREVVSIFVDGVRVLGLPRSVGEIYGLLFISPEPLSLDDLVTRLGISKGSVSQGLRTLRGLGAVRDREIEGMRRMHYEAAVELKRLVGGFIREQVRPHLESGRNKIAQVQRGVTGEPDEVRRAFYHERTERLENWMRQGGRLLPVLQKFLGQ